MSRNSGVVIFLTGPPASGKTSTGFLWSIQRERSTWPLEWDATAGALAAARELGRDCLPDDVSERYQLAAEVMARHAETITAGGNDCIVVGAWALDWPGPNPWESMSALDPIVCVLLPDVETSVARNARDPRRQGAFAVPEAHVRGSHALDWRRWSQDPRATVIDNSNLTLQQTVDALEHEVSRRITSSA